MEFYKGQGHAWAEWSNMEQDKKRTEQYSSV